MVGTDGITDVGLFLVHLSNLGTIEGVGHLTLLIGHLADVMQQSGTLGLLRVQTQLGCHNGTEVGRLTGMLQQVLSIAAAIFHFADDTYQLGMQTVDTQIDGCALACLHDLVVELLLHLVHNLLDAGRVYAAIGHQLVQGQATSLATHRVETADDDGFGGVVDHNLHATSSLQRTDVAPLTADNPSLYIVVINMEHRHAVLHSRLSGHTLDGLDDNFLGLGIGIEFGLVHDFVDIAGSGRLGLVLQALH